MSRTARISLLLAIDTIFFLVEIIVGYSVGSLALVADSFHMLNDILSLIVALYAIKLASQNHSEINPKYSYGWHRAEILAALINGVFLLALCFSIFMEAIERFFSTPEITNPRLVVIVGSLGLASNILGLFLFHEHTHAHKHEREVSHPPISPLVEHVENDLVSHIRERSLDEESLPDSEHSDSLFGHPAATRAYVLQQAQELQRARSPSPTRRMETSENSPLLINQSIKRFSRRFSRDRHRQVQSSPIQEQQSNPKSLVKHSHHKAGSMNMHALVLHVLGDALGNVGVIATGLVIWLTNLSWKYYFDPIISLVITCIIFSSALPLVKSASFILLQGVPTGIDIEEVDEAIRNVEGVQGVHELHIWQLSELKVVASVHVLVSRNADFMAIASNIRKALHDHGIHSSTIQPEYYPPKPQVSESAIVSSASVAFDSSCLITCPADQKDCNPMEHSCCPPAQVDA